MKSKHINITILLLFAILFSVQGQNKEFYFERITVEDGLSQSTVYSILQDQKGFLWFATQDRGLNKYDGYTFKNYYNNPSSEKSIPTNKISKIIQSKDGLIYIGTWEKGLCVFNLEEETFTTYLAESSKNAISSNKAQSLFEDSKGIIWIGTKDGGLNRFDPKTKEFRHFKHNPSDPNTITSNRIWDIKEDKRGKLWLATSNGVNSFDPETKNVKTYLHIPGEKNSLSENQIRSIYIDENDLLWIGTAVGLDVLDVKSGEIKQFKFPVEKIERNSVNRIYQDSYKRMWIGTHIGGLIQFDIEKGIVNQFTHDPNDDLTIGYNDIRDIYEDHSQNLWVATRGGGVNKLNLNPKQFNNIKNNPENKNSLSNNRVKSVIEDKNGNLWIGTDVGGGLDMYDRENERFVQYFHNPNNINTIASNDVSALMQDSKGLIWIGTDGKGISILNPVSKKIKHFNSSQKNGLDSDEIWTFFEDSEKTIWVGTNDGLYKYDELINNFIGYFNKTYDSTTIPHDCIWEIAEDSYGDIWIGTDNGLCRYNKSENNFQQFKNNPDDTCSLSYNTVFSIFEDKEKMLWIGTANGINYFDRNSEKFRCFNKQFDIIGKAIYGILEDDRNNLWLSTVNGISKFDKTHFSYRTFDSFDGLQNNDYSIGACVKTQQGEFVFGGVNGVTIFYADSIITNKYVPPVAITDFQIYNKSVEVNQEGKLKKHINYIEQIELAPEDDVISFYFTALDFTKPEKNQYKYFLEGFDKEWNFVKNRRFASYTNIPSGNYTLRIKASNNDNVWNEEGVNISIIKRPPFYETLWFYFIEAIIFILIIFFIFRLRVRSLEKDKRVLEQKVSDRTREIQLQKKKLEKAYFEVQQSAKSKEIFLANTSHEIRTPLNVIIGYCNLLMNSFFKGKELDYLKSIRNASNNLLVIINDILDISKIEAGKLSIEKTEFDFVEIISNIVNVIQIKVDEKNILFEQKFDAEIPKFLIGDPYRLNQILANLLDNAVKFTNRQGSIKLIIELQESDENYCQLLFKVKDSGIGIPEHKLETIFDSFTQASPDTTRKFGGTGLGLSIVKSLVDLQKGSISVESKIDKGTQFSFSLRYKIGTGENVIKKEEDYKISRARSIEKVKLLLVEDNKINITLAIDTIQLYNDKIQIDIAENGKIAVQKVRENQYDLVIMDVQMPVMDGYEATQQIRSQLPKEKRFVPILGMTAHAMKEEKEKCLSLGMNDYITKPFIPEELFKKIEQLIGDKYKPEPIKEEQTKNYSFPPDGNYIDITTLEKIYKNDKLKIVKILNLFKENIPEQLNELKESAINNNWKNLQVIAHSLKTSFNYLNLETLRNEAAEIENDMKCKRNNKTVITKTESILTLWGEQSEKLNNTIEYMIK